MANLHPFAMLNQITSDSGTPSVSLAHRDLVLAGVVISVLRWPALFILLAAALSLLYVFGPSKPTARWNWMTTGSLVATLSWLLVGGVFSWYLAHVADYSATYGALGGAIGLMMWLWLSFLVVLVGAELDQEIAHGFANVDSNNL
jgi:membrane protein